ncbi:MAG TPA: hypothetical protein VHV51_03375 [Polyangiaceae bacterium]|jgi:hypothetical protein|nr:hypothetical protein [Polyangiaceae bacterium]
MTELEDPPRLADGATDSRLSALFDAARADSASEVELSALAAKLGPELGAPAQLAGKSGLLVKVGAGAALLALGLTGVHALGTRGENHGTAPSAATSNANATTPSAATSNAEPNANAAPSALGETPPSDSAPLAAPSPNPSPVPNAALHRPGNSAANSVADEASLLERARAALGSNPAAALQLTNEHQKEFPRGALVQEREVIAIAALRRLGRTAEAERRAQAFDRTYPNSAHQPAVNGAASP